jgi:hypothetical protein
VCETEGLGERRHGLKADKLSFTMYTDGACTALAPVLRCSDLGDEAPGSPAGPRLDAGAGVPQSGRLAWPVDRPSKRQVRGLPRSNGSRMLQSRLSEKRPGPVD